jgi:hypothetical protein
MSYGSVFLLYVFLFVHMPIGCMQHHPGKALNLSIKKLSEEDIRLGTIVHAWGYTTFDQKKGPIIVTPLCPCTAIIAWVKTSKRGVALHAHHSNSIESGVETLKHELNLNVASNLENIQIFTLSKKMALTEYHPMWNEAHQGRSQEEHMTFVNQQLISGLGIQNHQLCTSWLSDAVADEKLKGSVQPLFADKSIVFDGTEDEHGTLKIKRADFARVGHMFDGFKLDTATFNFAKKSYCTQPDRSTALPYTIRGYNQLPFNKISEPNAYEITQLPKQILNPWSISI